MSELIMPPAASTSDTAPGASSTSLCFVCSSVTDNFYLNYGANACFSCRAFFRRAVRAMKRNEAKRRPPETSLKCKGRKKSMAYAASEACAVTPQNRSCRKCRFDRCLEAGMKPDFVLNDEQKQERFRKLLKKKKKEQDKIAEKEKKLASGAGASRKGRSQKRKAANESASKTPTSESCDSSVAWPSSDSAMVSSMSDSWSSLNSATTDYGQQQNQKQQQQQQHHLPDATAPPQPPGMLAPPLQDDGKMELSLVSAILDTELDCDAASSSSSIVAASTSLSSSIYSQAPPVPATVVLARHSTENKDRYAFSSEDGGGDGEKIIKPAVRQVSLRRRRSSDDKRDGQSGSSWSAAAEISKTSVNGKVSIQFRSSVKPEIFFSSLKDDENASEGASTPLSPPKLRVQGVRSAMTRYLDRVRRSWNIACKDMDVSEQFFLGMTGFQRGKLTLSKASLKLHFVTLAKLFTDFAQLQTAFVGLSVGDQTRLLKRNAPLFIQYILGRCFEPGLTGAEQLQWWLVFNVPAKFRNDIDDGLRCISFETFSYALDLFAEDEPVKKYEELCSGIDRVIFKSEFTCLVALACLYSNDCSMILDQPDQIRENLQEVSNFTEWASEVFQFPSFRHVKKLGETLLLMEALFSESVTWNTHDQIGSVFRKHIDLPYTREEEAWLQNQFEVFAKTYHEVSLGEDIIKEAVMYSLDVPLSKSFMPQAMHVWVERYRRLLKRHEEFHTLASIDQLNVWRSSIFDAVALSMTKCESCVTGSQQISFAFGHVDDSLFTSKFNPMVSMSRLKKISMREVSKSVEDLTPETLERYCAITTKLADLVRDVDTFKLITFITMFDCANIKGLGVSGLRSIQAKYLTLMKRRLAFFKGGGEAEEEGDDNLYGKFVCGLSDIKELADIVRSIMRM